jgi:hypothetical protein
MLCRLRCLQPRWGKFWSTSLKGFAPLSSPSRYETITSRHCVVKGRRPDQPELFPFGSDAISMTHTLA